MTEPTETGLLQQDEENRTRALAAVSFIVEAPAGAGKTELLTQRYLGLLARVGEPEEIVAITFTNKAAAEMRGRILDSLKAAADDLPVDKPHQQTTRRLARDALERSAAQGWELLAQPGRLRINTIDSLSSLLARQMPLMSRFGAQPAVAENASIHYQEAANRTLAMLEDRSSNTAVAEALAYFDNDSQRLTQQLAKMLAKRDQWLRHAAGNGMVQAETAAALDYLVTQDIENAEAVLPEALQLWLMPAARFAAANLPCDHPVALLMDWQTPVVVTSRALPMWRALNALLLTENGELRKEKGINVKNGFPPNAEGRTYKQILVEVLAAISDPASLARIRKLPDPENTTEEWRIIAVLAELLKLAAGQLMGVFQEAGEVDFVEVASRALQALQDETGPTDLALRLDYRIQHLLVDEFQDTSPAQIELLKRLTAGWEPDDGRTIFCVGDPMQSIYRFRKADVGLFLKVADVGIGHLLLQRLQLTRNNRSCPAVVDWVNAAFAKVFPALDSVTQAAISYRKFVATREAQTASGVEVHPLVAENSASADTLAMLEARYLADLIEREQKDNPQRSIAVLVRARKHLHALVAEIRRNWPSLKFQAVEVEALAERQTVQDALALTKALFHRADRVNWLAILRAPWCGLTLADLHALAAHDHYATIWQLMQRDDVLSRLTANGRQRLLHVREVIAEALAYQGRQPVRRWVEAVWLKLAGPQCLVDAGDVRDVQAFFDLVERLATTDQFDTTQLADAMSELYAAPDVRASDRLQFMTLHKSKGLQFDTVILPGLNRRPPPNDTELLLWEELATDGIDSKLIAAPLVPKHLRDDKPATYDYLQGLEAKRSANEAARVLYVGATRAERKLHLVGIVKQDAKGEVKPVTGTFLEMLWESLGGRFSATAEQPLALSAKSVDASSFIPSLRRLPDPQVPALLRQLADNIDTLTFDEPQVGAVEKATSLDADIGTLAHRYLEIIAQQGLPAWPVERLHSLQPAMHRWFVQRRYGESESSSAAAGVIAVLRNTLDSDQGRWVLQQRESAACELALASTDGAQVSLHVLDRTFVEYGERWVIDYKSTQLSADISESALSEQAAQHRPQLERYAALFKGEGLAVKKAVFFLALGRLVLLA